MKSYILEIAFKDLQPAVTRTVVMPEGATFKRLHDTIQTVTNFQDNHLYSFTMEDVIVTNNEALQAEAKRKTYTGLPVKTPSRMKIDTYMEQKSIVEYEYDFGDCWAITIQCVEVVEDYYFGYPTIIGGENIAPPENIGGAGGYQEFVATLANPQHPSFKEMLEWSEMASYHTFDMDQINEELKNVKYQKTQWDLIDHDNYFVLSDKYRGQQNQPQQPVENEQEIIDYILASANLYGFIAMPAFLKIYNDHHEDAIMSNAVVAVAMDSAQIRNHKISVYTDAIVHPAVEQMKDPAAFQQSTFGKPFYVPARTEFIKYREASYIERTAEIEVLVEKMEEELCNGNRMLAELHVGQFIQQMKKDVSTFNEAIRELFGKLPFKNEEQIHLFMGLFVVVSNNIRFWSNRGHKPSELSNRRTQQATSAPTAPKEAVKVGRNDPCPCGSGKKYKKCCGK